MVGLNALGGLVVFECKLANNSYGPFAAVLEGLDYLACLTSDGNFARVRDGFERWTSRQTAIVPEGFRAVRPMPAVRHEVVVLAPAGYFELYRRSPRGSGWESFAGLSPSPTTPSIRFAVSDFTSTDGIWATG